MGKVGQAWHPELGVTLGVLDSPFGWDGTATRPRVPGTILKLIPDLVYSYARQHCFPPASEEIHYELLMLLGQRLIPHAWSGRSSPKVGGPCGTVNAQLHGFGQQIAL